MGDPNAIERCLAASAGAAVAECATLPIDIAKVRLQTQAPLPDRTFRYTGFFQAMFVVGKEEGALALWRGISPALVRQVSYTSLSFVLYTPVRNALAGDTPKERIPFWKRVLAGGTAGGVSILVMNPTDVVKTQMQTYRGTEPLKMGEVATKVYQNAGIHNERGMPTSSLAKRVLRVSGFWRGWQPNVARCFIGNAAEIGCYDEVKTRLTVSGVPDGPLAHFGASGIAGVVSAIFSTPVDVVKTRLMAQAGGGKTDLTQYKGVMDCFIRMPRQEGISSLYKGFWPLAARKIAWTVAYFISYEQALKFVRGTYS